MGDASARASGATVRAIAPADAQAVSEMLGRAFWDDPLTSHLLPDETSRVAKLPHMFRLLMKLARPHDFCFVTSGNEVAALWRPPGKWHVHWWEYITNAGDFLGIFGANALSIMSTMDTVEKNHPKTPHWYLQVIGTDPVKQGKGYGGLIIRERLAIADAARMPCYLESSKDSNIPVYSAFGFKVTGEIKVPNGGPTLYPMWRDVQA